MLNSIGHKKISYMPLIEFQLLNQIYNLTNDGIHYIIYKKYFDEDGIKNLFKNKYPYWYSHTVNAYYDLAISHWCKIFGSDKEPTHYYKLLDTNALTVKLGELNTKKHLKTELLKQANTSPEDFDKYWKLTKKYRDRNLIHVENSPNKIKNGDLSFPELKTAKETFLSLIIILINLAKQFPQKPDEINSSEFIYDDFENQKQICDLIKKSFPKF